MFACHVVERAWLWYRSRNAAQRRERMSAKVHHAKHRETTSAQSCDGATVADAPSHGILNDASVVISVLCFRAGSRNFVSELVVETRADCELRYTFTNYLAVTAKLPYRRCKRCCYRGQKVALFTLVFHSRCRSRCQAIRGSWMWIFLASLW